MGESSHRAADGTLHVVRHPYLALPTPFSIGHRGCAGEVPENTLPSFERALEQGAAILESDVHLTRDGVAVLIHDPTVDRVTEQTGSVAELTWSEVRRLDAGYRFGSDGGQSQSFRGEGLRIPSLVEAFETFPDARFNLELKSDHPRMVTAAIDTVMAMGREDRTLLTAGDDAIMAVLRKRLAELPRPIAQGASTGDVLDFVRTALEGGSPVSEPMALQIPAAFAGRPLVTRELVDHAHAHDVHVHVWTINDPTEMDALLDLGVDGIITDFPARATERTAARRSPG
jgi:glycerophosphoryl diester phosphodiesterase